MKDEYKSSFKDSRILIIYIIVIIAILAGVTYALESTSIAFNLETGVAKVDEEAYGQTTFNSSNVELIPILDSEIDTKTDNVIKIDFKVGGASTNTVETIIYDIALVDLVVDCNLLSEYFKWKLVKDGEEISTGSFSYEFDTISNRRLVLTNTQLDLPEYNANESGYHNFSFYMWLSDSCQESDLSTCIANGSLVDQSALMGKSFKGKVEVELYTESKKELVRHPSTSFPTGTCGNNASQYIQNLYNDGNEIITTNIGGSTSNPSVSMNSIQGIMLDNNGEYRYYGANPNNYVRYNDELWRIISVSNVKSSTSDTKGETRVKIIKADILSDDNGLTTYSYDSSASTINEGKGVNDWSQADLMTELNTLYLNSASGTCYIGESNASTTCNFTNTGLSEEARSLTADAVYYLGGSSKYSGIYADYYYNSERGTTVWGTTSGGTCNDGACPRATTWTGRVGIIYPSDYAYATDLSVCTNNTFNYANNDNCSGKDWLLDANNAQYTITPYPDNANLEFGIFPFGLVYYGCFVHGASVVRPVQYLKSNVMIISGAGTSSSPYIIG